MGVPSSLNFGRTRPPVPSHGYATACGHYMQAVHRTDHRLAKHADARMHELHLLELQLS
jgi:hypothetical protein